MSVMERIGDDGDCSDEKWLLEVRPSPLALAPPLAVAVTTVLLPLLSAQSADATATMANAEGGSLEALVPSWTQPAWR